MHIPIHRKTILWLDDDFDRDKERILIWIEFFEKNTDKFRLIAVGNLKDFTQELKDRHYLNIGEEGFIDSILLDAMMHPQYKNANFNQFDPNFEGIAWKSLDAGVQILKIMQEPIYYARQPEWLHPYRERKTTLLTSNTQANIALNGITQKVRECTEVLIKDTNTESLETRLNNL